MEITASRFAAIDASHERARRGRRARMDALEQKQEEVNAAGAQVRALKAQNADADAIAAAIAELKRASAAACASPGCAPHAARASSMRRA